jgi:serine/threonine protein kinase
MSQRFVRCDRCGVPHDALQRLCPETGKSACRIRPRALSTAAAGCAIVAERAHTRSPPRQELLGAVVAGKYVLRRLLGAGGVGAVFEAEHVTIGRPVAIKVLHAHLGKKKEAVQRFRREARAAAAIAHPNVCQVFDLDALEDGSPFLVMEMLVGQTLAHRIAAVGRLPLYELIDILIQLLCALSAAHQKGIVHRDIKPENVFLTQPAGWSRVAKLLDFGVSKKIGARRDGEQDDVDLTRKGMVLGTPYCMSPEQARGDRDLDARVDLYACGVILYQALTGRRPFIADDNHALLREVLRGNPRPARDLRPALPRALEEILAKAMAPRRDDRYCSAEEFRRRLQSLRDARGLRASVELSASDVRPTGVWRGRVRPTPADDAAPTRLMRRLMSPDGGEDQQTVVRPRSSQ